jgi:hypothetical protein
MESKTLEQHTEDLDIIQNECWYCVWDGLESISVSPETICIVKHFLALLVYKEIVLAHKSGSKIRWRYLRLSMNDRLWVEVL